jgi:branched-chain amino acid aminotransferase
VRLVVSPVPRTSPRGVSPRGKMHNYLNIVLGAREVHRTDPGAWPVMLDEEGWLAEGEGCNLFLVSEERLLTPTERNILPGISRDTVIALARRIGIEVVEANLDLFDAANADEMFLTSTSLCICPAASFNGRPLAGVAGPLTRRLMQAFAHEVGFDFEGQYLRTLATAA